MKLGIKSLQRSEMERITKKEVNILKVDNEIFKGTVCLLKIIDINAPLIVPSPIGKVRILDKNYRWLQFAPKNENWWLTVMYDDDENIIESYFDITKENNFVNEDDPFFIDMKLDVAIPKRTEASLLDEDELFKALEEKLITQEEYDLAYKTANDIVKKYSENKDKYYEFIDYYSQKLKV